MFTIVADGEHVGLIEFHDETEPTPATPASTSSSPQQRRVTGFVRGAVRTLARHLIDERAVTG